MFVDFTDSSQKVIQSIFTDPQDPDFYPNQGEVEEDDPRYQAYIHPELLPENIMRAKQAKKDSLLVQASQSMTPYFLALQLGDATDAETEKAKAWQAYYRALSAVDVSAEAPVWPEIPS